VIGDHVAGPVETGIAEVAVDPVAHDAPVGIVATQVDHLVDRRRESPVRDVVAALLDQLLEHRDVERERPHRGDERRGVQRDAVVADRRRNTDGGRRAFRITRDRPSQ